MDMDAESVGFKKSDLRAIMFGLAFMVFFRFIGYLATKAPKVSSLGKPGFCLVVLGDIGRSPRMLLHARSALEAGYRVDVIGYKGSPIPEDLLNHPSIQFYYLREFPRVPEGMPKIVYYLWAPIKAILLSFNLFYASMFGVAAPDVFVVQVVNWLRQRHIVIDWHNYGASIVAQRLGQKSIFTRLVRMYESMWGFKATIHITVSRAMARDLLYNYEKRGKVITLYDRAPDNFRRLEVDEIHEFMNKIKLEKLVKDQSLNSSFLPEISAHQTLLTEKKSADGPATFRADRPALIVSSTSWTEEEDFSLLLEAAKQYDNMAKAEAATNGSGEKSNKANQFAKLLFVITGKGPMKQYYEEKISKMDLEYVVIVTAWLSPEDYPLLLGSADLGVSLHKSTSGVDLPMKVVDMFGCGLPVCAFKYPALSELVQAKSNGLVFEDAVELRIQLVSLFKGFVGEDPKQQVMLEKMRDVIKNGFQRVRWSENWNQVMWPLLRNLDKTWADAQIYAENPKFTINPRLVMNENYDVDDGLYDEDYEDETAE
ncbi:hypothetical protein BGW42_004094 [Actinomortierella wolfii]|nr:hypothetical protein BGW42_004094 [Actinomortierella wolfii]